MRRDVFHFYPRPVKLVYDAYQQAANERFGKNCRTEPYHTLSFGLNYSFRYNMNGGACNVHLIPYQNGTAVNIRYTIVQLAGARYGAHDRDLTGYVEKLLGAPAQSLQISADVFLLPQNQLTPGMPAPQPGAAAVSAPAPAPAPAQSYAVSDPAPAPVPASAPSYEVSDPAPAPAPVQPDTAAETAPQQPAYKPTLTLEPTIRTARFCSQCGSRLISGARFCDQCGARIPQ